MAAKKNKQPTEPFLSPLAVKDVPQDFNSAVALGLESGRAIQYWNEQQRYAMTTERKIFASSKARAWKNVSKKAQEIIKLYQLKLF